MKLAEAEQAIVDGCQELDMVVNISQVVSGNWDYVRREVTMITQAAHARGRRVKVIFENCYLAEAHKVRLCEICNEVQTDWAKTSTGFGPGGATAEDVVLMRRYCAPDVQVKASGGIRDLPSVLHYRSLGASRIGTSSTSAILDACRQQLGLPPIATAN